MELYTWKGALSKGIAVREDEKLGTIVYLGDSGRGRRYEKVSLFRNNPADVVDGRVLEAHPVPITINKGTDREKTFYTLAKPNSGSEQVLVRINTVGPYTRNTHGRWTTVAGTPETLVRGWGARGDAGRVGGWDDGLVIMSPGDILKVQPEGGHKVWTYALWYDADGLQTATWKDYENLMALKQAEASIAEASEGEGLPVIFGLMPAYTWKGDRVEKGIELAKGATGDVVSLGEKGRGRRCVEISTLGIESGATVLEAASVVTLNDVEVPARHSWETATRKVTRGLIGTGEPESGFLVRISTQWVYTRNTNGYIKTWKGSPTILAEGVGAHGAAGRVCGWSDYLVVMHEGDVLYVHPEGGYKTRSYALWAKNGVLHTQPWIDWKMADAQTDLAFYIEKGTAPWGKVPESWIGRIVTVVRRERSNARRDMEILVDEETGEVISTDPLILNMGWDGQDRCDRRIYQGYWIRLEEGKKVRPLEGTALEQRQDLRAKADVLQAIAQQLLEAPFFKVATDDMRETVEEIARSELATMPTTGGWGSLENWLSDTEAKLAKVEETREELQDLHTRQEAGLILVDFGGHFRRMGMSGNGDCWVVDPAGNVLDPTTVGYRKRYTSEGEKYWRIVREDDLALHWACGTMHDVAGSSLFEVTKAPVNGCTDDQIAAVARIEKDLGAPENSFGLNAEIQRVFEQRVAEIAEACTRTHLLTKVPEIDYLAVTSEWGQGVDEECVRGGIGHYVDQAGEFDVQIENRNAQVLDKQPAGNGVLEFLAYHKYGGWNLSMRWRELGGGETLDSSDDSDDPSLDGPMAAALREAGLI